MKPAILALLLSACAAEVSPPPSSDCVPPDFFADPACFDPGGGVRRCVFGDVQWDLRDGVATKTDASRHDPASSTLPALCEVRL